MACRRERSSWISLRLRSTHSNITKSGCHMSSKPWSLNLRKGKLLRHQGMWKWRLFMGTTRCAYPLPNSILRSRISKRRSRKTTMIRCLGIRRASCKSSSESRNWWRQFCLTWRMGLWSALLLPATKRTKTDLTVLHRRTMMTRLQRMVSPVGMTQRVLSRCAQSRREKCRKPYPCLRSQLLAKRSQILRAAPKLSKEKIKWEVRVGMSP